MKMKQATSNSQKNTTLGDTTLSDTTLSDTTLSDTTAKISFQQKSVGISLAVIVLAAIYYFWRVGELVMTHA